VSDLQMGEKKHIITLVLTTFKKKNKMDVRLKTALQNFDIIKN